MAFAMVFRRYAPFAQFGMGFEGDHRAGPSVSMSATARTIGIVEFDRSGIYKIDAYSSGTRFTGGGAFVRDRMFGGVHFSHVTKTLTNQAVNPNSISFTASTAGANPMVPGAPEIDTFVDFSAEWIASSIRMQGRVRGDNFPNAEVFVLDSTLVGCLLFDGRTTGGADTGPMTRLEGAHESQVLGSFFCTVGLSGSGDFSAAKPMAPLATM
jgi:hypothetical protein